MVGPPATFLTAKHTHPKRCGPARAACVPGDARARPRCLANVHAHACTAHCASQARLGHFDAGNTVPAGPNNAVIRTRACTLAQGRLLSSAPKCCPVMHPNPSCACADCPPRLLCGVRLALDRTDSTLLPRAGAPLRCTPPALPFLLRPANTPPRQRAGAQHPASCRRRQLHLRPLTFGSDTL